MALLPLARNDSTRRISLTKVLKYMAAGEPVVSTRITDIVELYGTMVGLGDSPDEFVAACDAALAAADDAKTRRQEVFRGVLARTSWDATAGTMAELIEAAARVKTARPTASETREVQFASRRSAPIPESAPVVVIGAGPTGLSAAYHPGEDAVLLEANGTVGGWCRSLVDSGLRSTGPATSCSRTTRTSTRCTSSCFATTSIGRTGRRGFTARTYTPATRSRGRCTACRRRSSRNASSGRLRHGSGASPSRPIRNRSPMAPP